MNNRWTYVYKFYFHNGYPSRNHVLSPRNVLIHEPKCKHFLWNFYLNIYCSALLNTLHLEKARHKHPQLAAYTMTHSQIFLPQIHYSIFPNFFATIYYSRLPNFFATNILQPTSKFFCHKYITVYFQIFLPQIYYSPLPNFFATNIL